MNIAPSINVHTHQASSSKEEAFLKNGMCPTHPDVIIKIKGYFSVETRECYRCEKIFNNNHCSPVSTLSGVASGDSSPMGSFSTSMPAPKQTSSSVWMLCGMPGAGKSSLFNYLTYPENAPKIEKRSTGDGVFSNTDSNDMYMDVLKPRPCILDGLESVSFVDMEGIGATTQNFNTKMTLEDIKDIISPEQASANKYAQSLKMTIIRALSGFSGVIMCVIAGERFTYAHQAFAKGIHEAVGEGVPFIICVTQCDRFGDADDTLEEKFEASKAWLISQREAMMEVLQLKPQWTKFVCVYVYEKKKTKTIVKDTSELEFFLKTELAFTAKIVALREEHSIPVAVQIDTETIEVLNEVSELQYQEVAKASWFEATMMLAFGIPAGIVGVAVGIPLGILYGLGWGTGKVISGFASGVKSVFTSST